MSPDVGISCPPLFQVSLKWTNKSQPHLSLQLGTSEWPRNCWQRAAPGTESQNYWSWKGHLKAIWSNPPAMSCDTYSSIRCSQLHPARPWVSPGAEHPPPLQAASAFVRWTHPFPMEHIKERALTQKTEKPTPSQGTHRHELKLVQGAETYSDPLGEDTGQEFKHLEISFYMKRMAPHSYKYSSSSEAVNPTGRKCGIKCFSKKPQ